MAEGIGHWTCDIRVAVGEPGGEFSAAQVVVVLPHPDDGFFCLICVAGGKEGRSQNLTGESKARFHACCPMSGLQGAFDIS